MRPLVLTASTAISAVGRGVAATLAALQDRRGGLRPSDFGVAPRGWIGRVDGVEQHRLAPTLAAFDCRNNRLADLALHTDGFADAVAACIARHGAGRIAVVIGTSTSGVLSGEEAYAIRDADGALPASFDYDHTQDMFSVARFVRAVLSLRGFGTTDVAGALRIASEQLARSRASRKITVLLSDCRSTVDGDVAAAARSLDELCIIAPESDSEDARELARLTGARWTTVSGPSTVAEAIASVLDR